MHGGLLCAHRARFSHERGRSTPPLGVPICSVARTFGPRTSLVILR